MFAELSPKLFGGISFGQVGEQAPLPPPAVAAPVPEAAAARRDKVAGGGPLRLTRYRSLFSGPTVERVPELAYQRSEPLVELSPADASVRGIASGDAVRVSSNGTVRALRARTNRRLIAGVVRAADEHVRGLGGAVEVTKE